MINGIIRDEGRDIVEPRKWSPPDDKRVPVLDRNCNPPRVIRYVGWRECVCCDHKFFSTDVQRVRMCDDCKAPRGKVAIRRAHGRELRRDNFPYPVPLRLGR